MGRQRRIVRWNIWMTAAKWCLTAYQLQSSFNCHLHQHGDGRVMEGNLCFCAWWRWRQRGERPTDERIHTHVHKGIACVWEYVISHTRKKRTTLSEKMRGSWDEDESNTVYTLNTFKTPHIHSCVSAPPPFQQFSWRISASQIVEFYDHVQIKSSSNMSMLWQIEASLDMRDVIRTSWR